VRALNKHGAVVDLGGIDGFVHLSELARHRVERAEDAVAIGDSVKARVLSVEASDKGPRVKLSIKALAAPDAENAPAPDEVLKATVDSVSPRATAMCRFLSSAWPPGLTTGARFHPAKSSRWSWSPTRVAACVSVPRRFHGSKSGRTFATTRKTARAQLVVSGTWADSCGRLTHARRHATHRPAEPPR
jgi:hypothetical protein